MYWREANSDFDALDADWNYEPPRAEVFQQIDAPLYTVDADGWLTYYNDAAAALWGLRPNWVKPAGVGLGASTGRTAPSCRMTAAPSLRR